MGIGCEWYCPNCAYTFSGELGVGMIYSQVHSETTKKAVRGELGKELKKLLERRPDAIIDTQYQIFRCADYGDFKTEQVLNAYIPKEGVDSPPKALDVLWTRDFRKYYDLLVEYNHKCKKCGGKAVRVLMLDGMPCPKCNAPLKRREGRTPWG